MSATRQPNGKYKARAKVCGRIYNFGTFDTPEAALAAIEAERPKILAGTSDLVKEAPTGRLNAKEYAEIIDVPHGTVKRWLHDGMPAIRMGGQVFIDKAEADAWVSAHHPNSISVSRESVVYFLRRERDAAIKIGWTSDLLRRIHELRKKERCAIAVVAVFPGDKPLELAIQGRFKQHEIGKEWFRPVPEILEFAATGPGRSAA